MNTYNDIYLKARKKLRSIGVGMHDLEARLIVSRASGKTWEEYLCSLRTYLSDDSLSDAVDEMIEQRVNGKPIAYVLGEWEFYGLPMTVNETVLIPRADTEVLAEAAIKRIKQYDGNTRVLDLCSGCGAIGLAIAASVPSCRVVLADAAEAAVALCRVNMLKNRLSKNVSAIAANVFREPPSLLGTFDAIVSNPPYIKSGDMKSLDSSVIDWEPSFALDGGPDGCDFFRAIASGWTVLLKEGGFMAFECGFGQAKAVCDIMGVCGFTEIEVYSDTGGIQRVIIGRLGTRTDKQSPA